jgi:cytidine deaminase
VSTDDWGELRAAATAVAANAYAPFSRLRVGAAGRTADGRIVTGCNVENASYGLTLCAECGLVAALHATAPQGSGRPARLVRVSVVAGDSKPLLPCGRCRQLLFEAGGGDLLVDDDPRPRKLSELLPEGFSGSEVEERREA